MTRRLALISGETFMGRSPVTENEIPWTAANRTVVIRENEKNRILDSAFHGNTILYNLTIPQSINYIGDFAFLGATALRTINNLSPVPQQVYENTFAGIPNKNIITLIVPYGTSTAFSSAPIWQDFNIVEAPPLIFERINNTDNARAKLIYGTPFAQTLVVPGSVFMDGSTLRISEIAARAFDGFSGHGIVLPQSITYIGYAAFTNTPEVLRIFSQTASPNSTGWDSNWVVCRPVYFLRHAEPWNASGRFWRPINDQPTPWPVRAQVSFNTQGATALAPVLVVYGANYGQLPVPSKAGFDFAGWRIYLGNGEFSSEFITNHTLVSIPENHTLYAVWEPKDTGSYNFAGGDGTQSNPWLIRYYHQLLFLSEQTNNGNFTIASARFKLTNNINLLHALWTPIGSPAHPFRGTFDGHNHLIYRFHTAGGNYQGLFGFVYRGTIKNLGIRYAHIYGNDFVGGIAGAVWYSSIFNSFNHGGMCRNLQST